MIRYIKLLRNIGTFDSDDSAALLEIKRLALIYADNARGKTTLAAVLRSLVTGDPLPINERQRLGSQQSPHVVLNCEGEPSNVMFQNGAWNRTLPDLKIYDDVFVDENVYSGLDVDAHHRQNLHELILGDQGVKLNHHLQDAVSRVSQHNKALEEKDNAIPDQSRGELSVDEFCALPKLPDIEKRMETAEQTLMAVGNQDAVRTAPLFEAIELPEFDIEAIRQLLLTDLPDLDRAAEAQVQAHVQTLSEGGELWVAEGMMQLAQGNDGPCPFCGQDITGLDLVAHYRAYFSDGYAQLKRDVADMIKNTDQNHVEGTQVVFERAVSTAKQTSGFWATYCNVPPIEINTESIVQDWNSARETVTNLLKGKQATPLEHHDLSEHHLTVITKFNSHRHQIKVINETLSGSNEAVREVKKRAETTNVETIRAEFARLTSTKARFSDAIAPLCIDYLDEKKAKARAETERAEARNALEEYRANVFPVLQQGVNNYLHNFNAGFRVDSLKPTNTGSGSGSACAYNVVINNTPIAVKGSKSPQGEPSFRNTLSAGDRNTLALALFFSSLDQNPNLANTIVVIDDPISSLDDHRSLTTIQAVRYLADRAGQVIVLSHNKRFLCSIWGGADRKECLPLEIAQKGGESTIRTWAVSQDAITEHDQRYTLLQRYAATQQGTKKEVAMAIRPHLEGFLRVACPGNFPPGKLLGPFIEECSHKVGNPGETLSKDITQELHDIVEYCNRFHHDTNPAWTAEDINATELLGFVQRTLAFVGPPRS